MILDNVPETLYAVCTAQEHAFQSIFDAAHIIIDDPKARETLELLNQGQQISRPSMDYLDKILKKKGFAVQEIVCKIASNDLPTENTESVDCETLTVLMTQMVLVWAMLDGPKNVMNTNVKACQVLTIRPDLRLMTRAGPKNAIIYVIILVHRILRKFHLPSVLV